MTSSNNYLNPSNPEYAAKSGEQYPSDGFAALVKVLSSRFASTDYPPESGFTQKIAITWNLLSTKGNQFAKKYSTGIPTGTVADIAPDGKRLIAKEGFTGFKASSDGLYLLQKAVSSGFDATLLGDDISVFEGHCFFVADDANPRWKGSAKKAYPKTYHPEGWDAALAAKQAKDAAKNAGQVTGQPATMTGSYAPPPVVTVDVDTLAAAGTALGEILATSGGKANRTEIPAKLNTIAPTKNWTPAQRQKITLALWDMPSLTSVVATLPNVKLENETVSFK